MQENTVFQKCSFGVKDAFQKRQLEEDVKINFKRGNSTTLFYFVFFLLNAA